MHQLLMPSATSHYIRCLAIDQHFGTQKAYSRAVHPTRKLARTALRGAKPALVLRKTNHQKATTKRQRNQREILLAITKHPEAIQKQAPRSCSFYREEPRKAQKAIQATTWKDEQNTQVRLRGNASRHPEQPFEKLRGIRKCFGMLRRNRFGITSGSFRGFRSKLDKARPEYFGTSSGSFWLFGTSAK